MGQRCSWSQWLSWTSAGSRSPDAVGIIEDEKKKTLGEVLRYLRRRVTLSDGWVASLEQGLDARNRFIHGFLTNSAERIADPSTRPDVVGGHEGDSKGGSLRR